MKDTDTSLPLEEGFRLRGHQGTRPDGLTDGIFALSVAVLLISSDVPSNFEELKAFLYDLLPFAICITFIYWIWRALNNFNLRYGLEDTKTAALKMSLMFFTLFYIYPLKFLMNWQTKYFAALFAGELRERYTELSAIIPFTKIPHLMIIYGVGFFFVFFLFFLMYRHALKQREPLALNQEEILRTRLVIRHYLGISMVGIISIAIAVLSLLADFSEGSILSGVAYNLVWIFIIIEGKQAKKKLAALDA